MRTARIGYTPRPVSERVISMRTVKFVGIALGGLVALAAATLVGVWLFVNPNDYKDRIAEVVKRSTGRELALPGTIKLSVFPWIALELGPASLGNPPGFGAEPFASVRHAALRVKLLPLLHRELKIGRIEIDGLDLRLAENAAGKGNWEGFGGASAASAPAAPGAAPLPDLAGLVVKDSRVSYGNVVADHVNFDMGHVGAGVAVPVKLKLDLTTVKGAAPIPFGANCDVILDLARKEFRFATLVLNGTIHPKPGAPAVAWSLSAPDSSVDLAAQTLNAPHFVVKLADARLTGDAHGARIIDAPSITGAFKLDSLAPRELFDHLGIAAPRTRDAKTLDKFGASAEFAYGGDALRLTKLAAQLDESHLTGSAAMTNLATHALQFDLALDRIDVDRYMSPAPTAASATPAAAKPAALPTAMLKALRLNGNVSIGSMTVAGVKLSSVRIGIVAKDGVTHIAPATAALYGGAYIGNITLDGRGATPAIKLDQRMTGIDIAQLAQDFARTRRISGRGNLTTKLIAHGGDSGALLRSLSGHAALDLANGAIVGTDLWWEVNRATALLQKKALPAGSGTGRTQFDAFKASADITDGVAVTKDLNIVSQNLRVTGGGSTNLATHAIAYRIMVTLLNAPAAAGAATARTLAAIPVSVTGTLTAPKVRADVEGIAKARLQSEFDRHKDELKKKLEDKLKSLFNR